MLQRLRISHLQTILRRNYADLNRPSPPPLPKELQREFEELQRAAAMPLSQKESHNAELAKHPDAPQSIKPEYEGDVNPVTGEKNGPKREPVRKWGDSTGDWSQKGRVTDF